MISFFKKNKYLKLADVALGHRNMTYRGIPAIKCPFDYVLYQMLIWEINPDLIIEIGTNQGGSTLYLADILDLIGKGKIHTIDIKDNEVNPVVLSHPRITSFTDGFENYNTTELNKYQTILIIDDGSHQYSDTLATLDKFSPFVSKGSYFIVEDGIVTELGNAQDFDGGPQRAIKEFLQNHPNFMIAEKWCNFFGPNATFNINGYLKRIS